MNRNSNNDPYSHVNYNESSKRKRKKKSNGILYAIITVAVILLVFSVIGIISAVQFAMDKFSEEGQEPEPNGSNSIVNEKNIENDISNKKDDTKDKEPDDVVFEHRVKLFMQKNPDLSEGDAEWMVKVDMDKIPYEKFTTVSAEDLNNELTIIVNKNFKVPDDYQPPDLVTLTERDKIRSITKDAFDKMRADAKSQGFSISPASGFRTVAYQEGLYNRYKNADGVAAADTYSARAGFSEHHTGLVIDVIGSNGVMTEFGKCKESAWVNENAHKYGFIVRYLPETEEITKYTSEPWHLRYIGIERATEMKENGIKSLEEYRGRFIL